ncbi:MAG TPA: thioredoxin domain-containing protein [Polyangiaceae bacterium]
MALGEDLRGAERVWLVQIDVTASEAQIGLTLEQQGRFALGVPGLARPVASGVDAGAAFLAFAAPLSGSVADAHVGPWSGARVALLATRIAAALAPLHDQGIAYGCLRPELVAEGDAGDVLFGFGIAAVATAFGAAGEASQLLPPEYRAPELRASLLPPTPASDVFALGVLLRELLSAPQSSADPAALNALSSELEACLARATAPEARARPRDVRVFAVELARLAELEPERRPVAPVSVDAPRIADPEAELALAAAPLAMPIPLPAPVGPSVPYPPAAPLFAVPSTPPRYASSLGVWLLVGAGLLLMVGGVVSATYFAARRAALLVKAVGPALHAPVAPKFAPPSPSPSVTASEEPPPLAPALPETPPIPDKPARAHPPVIAPGVGPASFPEEARAALPVLGSEPIWGTRNAPLTWVLFGDLDCPHTRRAWRALEVAKLTYGDDLRIVFRHRPLREHPNAFDAARVLAGLSRERGSLAFFDVLHRISRDEASLTAEHLQELLSAAGYGSSKLSELAAAGDSAVRADMQLAGQFAVKSTPFSFLNGQPVDGERAPAELERLLLDERRSATWSLAAGVAPAALYGARTSSNLIGVGEQAASRVCAPVGTSPARGPADALVTVVEFSDFECPFCKQAEPTLHKLLDRYPRDVRLVWKNYPLPQHKNARLLANFAADASARGSSVGFWAVHDALFLHQEALDDSALGELAGKAGLDGALLLISAHAGVHDAAIHADIALGQKLGVKGTPTFFVNGRRVQGALTLDQFEGLVQEELKSAQRIVARGVARKDVYGLVCE